MSIRSPIFLLLFNSEEFLLDCISKLHARSKVRGASEADDPFLSGLSACGSINQIMIFSE